MRRTTASAIPHVASLLLALGACAGGSHEGSVRRDADIADGGAADSGAGRCTAGQGTEEIAAAGVGPYIRIAVDGAGGVHVAWQRDDPDTTVVYAHRDASGWRQEELFGTAGWGGLGLAASAEGRPHVVADVGGGLVLATKYPDGLWRTQDVPTASEAPEIAVDPNGGLHVVADDFNSGRLTYAYRSDVESAWRPESVPVEQPGNPLVGIALLAASDGSIHILHPQGISRLDHAWKSSARAAWSTEMVVEESGFFLGDLRLFNAEDGRLHAMYSAQRNVPHPALADWAPILRYAHHAVGSSEWQVADLGVPATASTMALANGASPRIAYFPQLPFWASTDLDVLREDDDASWNPVGSFGCGVHLRADLTSDACGCVHAAYEAIRDGHASIAYSWLCPGTEASPPTGRCIEDLCQGEAAACSARGYCGVVMGQAFYGSCDSPTAQDQCVDKSVEELEPAARAAAESLLNCIRRRCVSDCGGTPYSPSQ